jgi:excisionase family DNA binding protein
MALLDYREAADLLGVNRGTLYRWVHEQTVPHIRYSARMVRFDSEVLTAWIDARRIVSVAGSAQHSGDLLAADPNAGSS